MFTVKVFIFFYPSTSLTISLLLFYFILQSYFRLMFQSSPFFTSNINGLKSIDAICFGEFMIFQGHSNCICILYSKQYLLTKVHTFSLLQLHRSILNCFIFLNDQRKNHKSSKSPFLNLSNTDLSFPRTLLVIMCLSKPLSIIKALPPALLRINPLETLVNHLIPI